VNIYLDVCCLNRPFDDHTQDRIHLESEAVLTILRYCRLGKLAWVSSRIVDYEVLKTPDGDKRQKVFGFTELKASEVEIDHEVRSRAKFLEVSGFKSLDALHIACAEKARVEVFLTTDDQLLKMAKRHKNEIRVPVENPLKWLLKIRENT